MKKLLIVAAVLAVSLLTVKAHAFPGVVFTGVGYYQNTVPCPGSTNGRVRFAVAMGRSAIPGTPYYTEHAEIWDPGRGPDGSLDAVVSVTCPSWTLIDGDRLWNAIDPNTSPFPWPLNYSATVCRVYSRPAVLNAPLTPAGTATVFQQQWMYSGGVESGAPYGTINVMIHTDGSSPQTSCLAGGVISAVAR